MRVIALVCMRVCVCVCVCVYKGDWCRLEKKKKVRSKMQKKNKAKLIKPGTREAGRTVLTRLASRII